MSRILFEFFDSNFLGEVGFSVGSPLFVASAQERFINAANFATGVTWSSSAGETFSGASSFRSSLTFSGASSETFIGASAFQVFDPSFIVSSAERFLFAVLFDESLAFVASGQERFVSTASLDVSGVRFDAFSAERFVSTSTFSVASGFFDSDGSQDFTGSSAFRVPVAIAGNAQERFVSSALFAIRVAFTGTLVHSEPTGVAIIYAYGSPSLFVSVSPTLSTMIDVTQAPTTLVRIGAMATTAIGVDTERTTAIASSSAPHTLIEVEREDGIMSRNVGDSETLLFRFLVFDAVSEERVLTDPGDVLVHVVLPDKSSYRVQFGVDPSSVIDRIGVGRYWVKVPFPMAGPYNVLFQGTAPAQGTEPTSLQVEAFKTPFPTFTP